MSTIDDESNQRAQQPRTTGPRRFYHASLRQIIVVRSRHCFAAIPLEPIPLRTAPDLTVGPLFAARDGSTATPLA
jgi:hypothetical protein